MANWSVGRWWQCIWKWFGPAHCISAPNSSQRQIHFGFLSESATVFFGFARSFCVDVMAKRLLATCWAFAFISFGLIWLQFQLRGGLIEAEPGSWPNWMPKQIFEILLSTENNWGARTAREKDWWLSFHY